MGFLGGVVDTLRPDRDERHGPLVPMMVALTLLTGLVDAVSYLRLGHVFVANMTGNVVFLGFALAGASGLSVLASLLALLAFLLGAFAGGRLGASEPHRGRLLRAANAVQASLILLALLLALLADRPLAQGVRYGLIAVLALAMGVQNSAAQQLAVPDLTTTVLTKTLTGIASEGSLLSGGERAKVARRVVAVAAMLLGALGGGALALHVSVAAPLAVAFLLAAAVGLVAHLLSRSSAGWTRA
jgi:uncharacterized membrane protein YoaK (UPF0700 family)